MIIVDGRSLLLCCLTMTPLFASPMVPTISVNVTTVRANQAVRVSWTALEPIAPMHVNFYSSQEEHVHRWQVEPEDAMSFWVGQFSPPIASASSIAMGSNPESRGIATEGTPPFTVPAPVKFISGLQLQRGAFDFIVSNMRAPVNWVLFSGSLTSAANFKVLAISKPVELADADEPMHLRLARTSSVNQMRVSWTSSQAATPAAPPLVQFGATPTQLDQVAAAKTHTYTASDLCGFPANASGFHHPGYHHSAILDLAASNDGDMVYYRVGSTASGWSPVRAFAKPETAQPHARLSVLIAADMGETYEDGSQYHWEEPDAVNTTVHMAKKLYEDPEGTRIPVASSTSSAARKYGVDLVLHPGDLAYATGYASEWDRWMAQIEPLSAHVPYMTGMGNHERDFPGSGNSIGAGDSGGECGVPTQSRFHMPTCPQPNVKPCLGQTASSHGLPLALGRGQERLRGPVGSSDDGWYSFNQGPLHVLMLHTEMPSDVHSRQYAFVAADLKAVNRAVTPWVVVLGHRQMYSDNLVAPTNELGSLEPLLYQHKVDIAFWGHIHFAQRSCPMVNATCVTTTDASGYDAPIHAVIGNAGQSLTNFTKPRANWSVYEAKEWGFSHMTIHNATHLTLDFYADAPLDAVAPRHHSVTLVRAYPRA